MNRTFKQWTANAAVAIGLTFMVALTPASAATLHTAKANDTFWKLSKQYNVDVNKLIKANPAIDPLNIYAGLKISIPGAKLTGNNLYVNGKTFRYSKSIRATATAYSSAPEENGWGPVDYYGSPLKVGTVAVDPNVIPLGTKLFITGYDFARLPQGGLIATATDTGSAIKGNRIDIFVNGTRTQVKAFGIQDVKVYVLK